MRTLTALLPLSPSFFLAPLAFFNALKTALLLQVAVKRLSFHVCTRNSERALHLAALSILGRTKCMCLGRQQRFGLLVRRDRCRMLEERLSQRTHTLFNNIFRYTVSSNAPLVFELVTQLKTLDLHFALPLVVQDTRIGLHIADARLLVPLSLCSKTARPEVGQVTLHIAISATAPRRLQANAVVHGGIGT